MKNIGYKKGVVFGIIVLFIGMSVVPSTAIKVMIEKPSTASFDGNTFYVGGSGPGNYTSIQDAVDNASDGDTVFVYDDSSPYYERVKVNKSINLIGEDRNTTIIDASGVGSPLDLETIDGVYVSGFTLQNSGNTPYNNAGIHFGNNLFSPKSHRNTITGNKIINNWDGIFQLGSNYNNISYNIFINNRHAGIYSQSGGHNNNISNNIFTDNDWGIYIDQGPDDNFISKNFISNNFVGIELVDGNDNILCGNVVTNNKYGIGLASGYGGCTNNSVKRNKFEDNIYGLVIVSAINNFIIENNFIENEHHAQFDYQIAIFIIGLTFLGLKINKFISNYWGINMVEPKIIRGRLVILYLDYAEYPAPAISVPWFQADWHPAKEPYEI